LRIAFWLTILVPILVIVGMFAWWLTADVRADPRSQAFVIALNSILVEAFAFVLIGAIVASLIEVLVTPEQVQRFIPRSPLLAVLVGALLGAVFPVCECGVIPVVRRLIRKGVPLPAAIAYLLAAPIVNPIVIVSTIVAFQGRPGQAVIVPVCRVVLGVGIAVAVGAIVGRLGRNEDLLTAAALPPSGGNPGGADPSGNGTAASVDHQHFHAAPRSWRGKLGDILSHSAGEFVDVGRFLVLGALLAASMQTFVPRSILVAMGGNLVSSIAVMLALAFVLSLCSEADAFVASSFIQFTTAAKVGFLVLGPMLDIKLILMYLSVFRRRLIIALIVSVVALNFLVAMALGVVLRYFQAGG
jgi:uncharacterized membrane protein YraQ (UPF0718 family)